MPILPCRICGDQFEAKTDRARYCSQRCKDKGKPSASGLTCFVCGESMVRGRTSKPQGEAAHNACRSTLGHGVIRSHGHGGYSRGCRCEVCRAVKAEHNRSYRDSHRAKYGENPATTWRRAYAEKHGVWPQRTGGDAFISHPARVKLYERDNWTCQICGEAVDPTAHYNDDRYPTLDHIIPQSAMLIPDHSPSNLRTACRLCNATRGAALV